MIFIKTKENFICENCGEQVEGDGYTNHCPKCLYSKHVDVNPGDRAAECGGLMKPVAIQKEGEDFFVVQKCLRCSHERRNRVNKNDDFNEVIRISNSVA